MLEVARLVSGREPGFGNPDGLASESVLLTSFLSSRTEHVAVRVEGAGIEISEVPLHCPADLLCGQGQPPPLAFLCPPVAREGWTVQL